MFVTMLQLSMVNISSLIVCAPGDLCHTRNALGCASGSHCKQMIRNSATCSWALPVFGLELVSRSRRPHGNAAPGRKIFDTAGILARGDDEACRVLDDRPGRREATGSPFPLTAENRNTTTRPVHQPI